MSKDMDAWRFGLDSSLPPAFKFDPTDADLVAHYLLPRALNLHGPHAHAVVDADPASCPPWELMRRHGHAGSGHAFFFGPPRDPTKRARSTRAVPPGEDGGGVGGTWHGQKSQVEPLFLVRGGGDMIELKYKRFNLTYYSDSGGKSSGWVMHEYQIVDPPLLPGAVLARVKMTDAGKKERSRKLPRKFVPCQDQPGPSGSCYLIGAADAQKFVPCQYQPGPSGNHYLIGDLAAGNAVLPRDGAGTSSSAQVIVVQGSDNDGVDMSGEPVVNYTELLHSEEGIGCYSDYFTENMNNYFSQGADATTTVTA